MTKRFPHMKNPEKSWKKQRSESGPDLGLFRVRYDHMENPRNGKVLRMVVLESLDSVNVVPVTKEGKIVMVKQYRFGVGEDTLELPGGLLEPGESQEAAARRELAEETGYTGGRWSWLGDVQANPVFMDNQLYHWLAIGVEKTEDLKLDDGEDIEVLELSIEEVKQAVQEGEIQHPHVVSALARVFPIWEYPKLGQTDS
jgi:ADP-ribose pyrophosphatase